MRVRYWSNSKFADSLRKVFGLPKNLPMGTCEEWNDFHELEKKTSPFGIKVIDFLDTIQTAVYFIPDQVKNASYFIGNVLDSTHVLKTNTKLGQWSDLSNKIPEAILLSIVDFIEQECFHMRVMWWTDDCLPADVAAYKNQSYIRRKLYPVKVSDLRRGEYGLKYIAAQMEEAGEEATIAYQSIIDAYKFAKGRFKTFDPYEESGYNLLPTMGVMKLTENHKEVFEVIRKLEEEHNAEIVKHCTNIIKHHEYLWT